MAASINDYFNKASNMNGSYPPVATVSAARATGGKVLTCNSLSGWATDTPVHFSTFKVNTDGTINTSSQTDWKGIVVGNTITEMKRIAGAADSGNASGDRVELNPTIGWANDLMTGILVAHKQTGALKDASVSESTIATGAVTSTKLSAKAATTAKIDDAAVTEAKLANSAVTTAKIKDGAVTSDKVDFSTFKFCGIDTGTKLQSLSDLSTGSRTDTITSSGWLKGCYYAKQTGDAQINISIDGVEVMGSGHFYSGSGSFYVPFLLPVIAGQKVKFYVAGNGAFSGLAVYAPKWG